MTNNARASRTALEALDGLIQDSIGGLRVPREARRQAFAHARAVANGSSASEHLAMAGFVTDMFAALAVELAMRSHDLRRLIDELERVTDIPRVALARCVLAAPQLLRLPAAVGIEVQLALLLAFSDVQAVSLWDIRSEGELKAIAHAGAFDREANQTRRLARKLLASKSAKPMAAEVAGVLVDRRPQPAAALISRGKGASRPERLILLQMAAPILSALLERDELLGRGSSAEQAVVAATERRLARLRFDLHDGPQQDLVLLAEDLRFFASQLTTVLHDHPERERVLDRFEDLQARLVALDGALRQISATVQSPFMQPESLPDALSQLTDAFTARSGIEPDMRLEGDLYNLTDSQQITLLGLIRESLSNIREHSDAEHVTIELNADVHSVEARVTDDGRGFEPEATLLKAAREGHLGLVGMHERVRLLGGTTQIESRPGGPTVISISLPSGPPVAPYEPVSRTVNRSSHGRRGRMRPRPSGGDQVVL
jgi:signal transduction histidine kinase